MRYLAGLRGSRDEEVAGVIMDADVRDGLLFQRLALDQRSRAEALGYNRPDTLELLDEA